MTLQERITRLIREREVTLAVIAQKTGVTPRTIQNYAKGITIPKTEEKYLTVCEQIDELYESCPQKKSKKWYYIYYANRGAKRS